MWRTLFAAVTVYACGHPHFDGYRPVVLDRPFQEFHQVVNEAARDGRKVIATLDDARSMRYLKGYINRMDAMLRSHD
jgi:hypothetical protein